MTNYTAYVSWPGTPRGFYDEEIDVEAANPSQAKKKAQAILDEHYAPEGKIRKIVKSPFIQITSW